VTAVNLSESSHEYAGLSLSKLPTIHTMKYHSLEASRITIFLMNIPFVLAEEERIEVTLWRYVNNSVDAGKVYPEYTILDIGDGRAWFERGHSAVVTMQKQFVVAAVAVDTNVKVVMRFLRHPPSSRHLNTPPTPVCLLASYCSDSVIFSPKNISWMDSSTFTAEPGLMARHGPSALAMIELVQVSLSSAEKSTSKLSSPVLAHRGLSGPQFRHFMNNLGAANGVRYLEIGTFYGSTLFSTIYANTVRAVAIDSWDDKHLGTNASVFEIVQNNLRVYQGDSIVELIISDAWSLVREDPDRITQSLLGKANVYFYDAAHEEIDHFMSLSNYLQVLEDVFIFIVDDWDMPFVRDGTHLAIESLGLDILLKIEIITAGIWDNSELKTPAWHNGMVAFVLGQPISDQQATPVSINDEL
jgi:hypothetical protein